MVVIRTCNIDFFVNCTSPLQQKKSWKKQSTSTQQYDIYPLSQASDKDSIKMELLRQFYEESQNVLYLSFYSFISSAIRSQMNVICSWMQCSDLRMRYCCVFVMFAPRQVYLGVTGRQKRDVIRAAHRAETDQGGGMIIKYDLYSF